MSKTEQKEELNTQIDITNERTNELYNTKYTHTHTPIHIRVKRERNFYVTASFQATMNEMDKILKREGKSLSRWIREQIQGYVILHSPGNPQQFIERYVEHESPYLAPGACGFRGCDRQAEWLGYYGEKRYRVCNLHYESVKDSKTWTEWTRI